VAVLSKTDKLSQGCTAVFQAAAQALIVARSLITFCFVNNALVTTLFSTALVDVVERSLSIEIVIACWCCNIQLLPSYRYQSFIATVSVSTVTEACQDI
jgi:hypothetical protein